METSKEISKTVTVIKSDIMEYDVTDYLYKTILTDKKFAELFWLRLRTLYPNKEIVLLVH